MGATVAAAEVVTSTTVVEVLCAEARATMEAATIALEYIFAVGVGFLLVVGKVG